MSVNRIHILGASGSGTTTLGKVISERFGYAHLDADDFYWEQTDPLYQVKRDEDARRSLLATSLPENQRWVVSGSLCSWGDIFIPLFELVIFLWVPSEIRITRLRKREFEELGDIILPGGSYYEQHIEFLKWAAEYDEGPKSGRSKKIHEEWLKKLPCPVIRIEGDLTIEEQLEMLFPEIQ